MQSRNEFLLLSTLLVLFCLRVIGQILVAFYHVSFLPPMHEWQSGLLPYPALLACQIAIIALFGKVCFDFYRCDGYFYQTQPALGKPLLMFGKLYAAVISLRLIIWTTMIRHHIWYSGTIPIFFHLILASFVILVAQHHRDKLATLNGSVDLAQDPVFERI